MEMFYGEVDWEKEPVEINEDTYLSNQTPKIVNEVVNMFELLSVNHGVQDVDVGDHESEYLNFEIDDLRKRISFFESFSKKPEEDVQSESQTVEKSEPELVLEETNHVSEVCEPKQVLQSESAKEEKTDKDPEQAKELIQKHSNNLISKLKRSVTKVKKMIIRKSHGSIINEKKAITGKSQSSIIKERLSLKS